MVLRTYIFIQSRTHTYTVEAPYNQQAVCTIDQSIHDADVIVNNK
jgi:hypothetical protein